MEPTIFQEKLAERGVTLTAGQMGQFEKYYTMLVEWNEKINLTAITEKGDVYEKHFFDSISASFFFDFSKVETLIDIGAGAGFPSLPIKIIYPHLRVTIVDSLNKRITFLQQLAQELGLQDVACVHGRAEELGINPQYRDRFDVVTARAVARLNILSEFCLPFAKAGGVFLVLKGADASNELDEAKKAIKTLGGKTEKMESFQLPNEQSERSIILIHKLFQTPKGYPRKAGTPAKKPIV
ncbi:16S rRNA (guanine(527)-N(7))-methyltransferase RsmG [Ammoniphilus sp. CFH 90114]|uniref:16S rRNA (guanine(527)-N(7))-methyltransferase RsmG n=1 Tax=Ammoniphilus sp. CFH 90114 TaxID=2493665 RepID=UPI00100EB5BA|nr:16S rRNA (guanine(527)-N(7))-methyltransferase RsmG [Ammoniphilus sp. CFH 90114]RXT08892.1 16S rRNA (guanine(527)-N(7))-methyltransferase RsmG [Ammoniphilus sp. CFH 90114]